MLFFRTIFGATLSVFFILSVNALTQQSKEYEYGGDDFFLDTTITNEYEVPEITYQHFSIGFFPYYKSKPYFMIIAPDDGDYSTGSLSLSNNTFKAGNITDLTEKKMKEKQPFSNKKKSSVGSDETDNLFMWGLEWNYPVSFFDKYAIITSISAGYRCNRISAYTDISDVPFLDGYGRETSFETISVAEIIDKYFYGRVAVKIPVYGVAYTTVDLNKPGKVHGNGMFYYLYLGAEYNNSFHTNISQFDYILTQQNIIRYNNGEIKQALTFKENYDSFKQSRFRYILGIGTHMAILNYKFDVGIKYKGSSEPTISNTNFHHNLLMFDLGLSPEIYGDFLKFIISLF